MKKSAIIAILSLALALVGFGAFGRWRADQRGNRCTAEAGPFCFMWERNGIGKLEDAVRGLGK